MSRSFVLGVVGFPAGAPLGSVSEMCAHSATWHVLFTNEDISDLWNHCSAVVENEIDHDDAMGWFVFESVRIQGYGNGKDDFFVKILHVRDPELAHQIWYSGMSVNLVLPIDLEQLEEEIEFLR